MYSGLDEKGQDKEGASENVEKDQAVKRDLEKQEADTTDQMVAGDYYIRTAYRLILSRACNHETTLRG